jgi:hypothetical protein
MIAAVRHLVLTQRQMIFPPSKKRQGRVGSRTLAAETDLYIMMMKPNWIAQEFLPDFLSVQAAL